MQWIMEISVFSGFTLESVCLIENIQLIKVSTQKVIMAEGHTFVLKSNLH